LRQHPFTTVRLQDEDLSVDFARLTTPSDRVAVVVTEPLTTDEPWIAFAPGEMKVFVHGRLLELHGLRDSPRVSATTPRDR